MEIKYNPDTDNWEIWENGNMIYENPNIYNVCSKAGFPLEQED